MPKDVAKARRWFTLAIAADIPGAMKDLAAMEEREKFNDIERARRNGVLGRHGDFDTKALLPAHMRCAKDGCGAPAA